LLQQLIAPLEGVFAHFSNNYVLHHPEGNERTGDIRPSWADVTTVAGPILLKLGRATKMAVFWSYFRDFVGAQKIEDLSEFNNFFAEVFQITSRFVLAKKILGVRCTLNTMKYSAELVGFTLATSQLRKASSSQDDESEGRSHESTCSSCGMLNCWHQKNWL